MKKYLFFATALAALASCTSNDFVGEDTSSTTNQSEQAAIAFGTGVKTVTRADYEGAAAATKLNNKFIVGGFKGATGTSTVYTNGNITTEGVPTTTTVYDNYQVKWGGASSAHSTTSNTSGWEYVSLDFLEPSTLVNTAGVKQSIKYWDYSAEQYDFIAYSTSDAGVVTDGNPAAGEVKVSVIDAGNAGKAASGAYTLRGDAADLEKCYIADMVTAYRSDNDFEKEIEFKFRPLTAKVRIALYETIPGYSVKDVVFYSNATTVDSPTAPATWGPSHLFTTGDDDKFNEKGTYTVYFPTIGYDNKGETDYNKAHVKFTPDGGTGDQTQVKDFGTLDYTNKGADKEGQEANVKYLGRSSSAATYAGTAEPLQYYTVVLPNESGAVLNLQVDYKLVSTDGSGEVINVTKASAKVPKEYATWKSGYAYTYLFKISQNTNGWTNPDPSVGPAGLYPITFDAIVVNDLTDNTQETITTVAEPSITTYAKGTIVTTHDEYTTGSNIYVLVEGNNIAVGNTANLYTVTIDNGASQTINEASVANALKNGTEDPTGTWTVTDANSAKLTVVKSNLLKDVTEVAAEDAPNGNAIQVNGAKFTPTTAGTYAFQYAKTITTPAEYEAVDNGTTLTSGNTYYTSSSGAGLFIADGTEVANGTNFYQLTTPAVVSEWVYKIIKVVD